MQYAPSPTQRGSVLIPGLPALPSNLERHPIPGGGSRAVQLDAGDICRVIDLEGMQPAEVAAFAPSGGSSDPGLLNTTGHGKPGALASLLHGDARARAQLEASRYDLTKGETLKLFGPESRAGENFEFTANAACTLIVGAPGEPMPVDEQTPPTDIVLYVERSARSSHKPNVGPPAPLGDMLDDINIQPGTARAYEVKAGQYVQIVDVRGRECTDFQAFSLRALDRGLEREIDPTTTRTLMGALYPAPGLFSKYYSVDHEPLVQIVQDTCGRHDSFGLACTARYYEDMGYPGHANCSDNMSEQLEHFGVVRRAGWPAINFFFNTMLDETNAIGMDDPWSRPGDYVLVRALTDLVCVSTGCPCDIDPANGWNPTDIQVRIYDENEDFKSASAFRMTTDADPQMTKETGFHTGFAKHTRNFGEYNGYWLAQDFPNHRAIDEYWACRERAIVTDLSPLRKYEVLGPDAEHLLNTCLTRNVRKLSVGQVVYSAMCYEHGGMIDDGTLFRLGDDNFRWIGGTDLSGVWLREKAAEMGLDVWVKTSTDQMCNIAVQGPKSREILEKVIWTPPTQSLIGELGWFRFCIGRLGDFHGRAVVVSRTGYTGELGYEVFCHPNDAIEVFDAVMAVGEPLGLAPLGLEALNMLRIESGLVFAGCEFTDQTDPFEAGIGFTVPLKSKDADFIGRDALLRRKESPTRTLVGLDVEGGTVPVTGDCVHIGRAQVGEVTSATRSPILGKTIALCRIDITHAQNGTSVEIGQLDGHQKRIPSTVVPFPHFDPTKERVKGNYPIPE